MFIHLFVVALIKQWSIKFSYIQHTYIHTLIHLGYIHSHIHVERGQWTRGATPRNIHC